jgi:hypothetical protein
MPRGVAKSDLPSKPCAVCGRMFSWRRKWARTWEEVRYCSERCRGERGRAAQRTQVPVAPGGEPTAGPLQRSPAPHTAGKRTEPPPHEPPSDDSP